jgi:hypothetical protein
MPRFRFSLLAVLGAIAACAVMVAALTRPNRGWAVVRCTTNVSILLYAALVVAFHGRRKAFWLGYAIVGWLLVFPLEHSLSSYELKNFFLPRMAVDALTEYHIPTPEYWLDPSEPTHGNEIGAIGVSLASMTVAATGGLLACWVARKPPAELRSSGQRALD